MDQHDIPVLGNFYTKAEVDAMIAEAVEEARESMKHRWQSITEKQLSLV